MNSARIDRWTKQLNDQVEKELGHSREENVILLIEHLSEYIQRWIGFSYMEEIQVVGTLNTDAFCIILGARNVVNGQIERHEAKRWFPVEEWRKFENSLDYIQKYPTEDNLSIVTESFNRLWEALFAN